MNRHIIPTIYRNDLKVFERQRKGNDICKVYKPKVCSLNYMLETCNEQNLIWERKSEVDWSKVPVDTKILVKCKSDRYWKKRHFAKYEDGKIFAFSDGTTSWSIGPIQLGRAVTDWEQAKLAEEE